MLHTFLQRVAQRQVRSWNRAPLASRGPLGKVLVLAGMLALLATGALALPLNTPVSAHTSGQQKSANVSIRQDVFTRQDVFVRGANNQLYHRWSTAPNVWTNWVSLGRHLDSSPSVTADPMGGIDVFYRDGADIWRGSISPSGNQVSWENLGHSSSGCDFIDDCFLSPFTSAPAAAGIVGSATSAGSLDVFAFVAGSVNGSHILGHKWLKPIKQGFPPGRIVGYRWSDWEILSNANFADDPAAVSWGSGRIDVFVHGSADNQLYDKVFDGGKWSNWQALGGKLTSSPAAFTFGPGNIKVFARNSSNTISTISMFNHAWSSWSIDDDGPTSAAPAATTSASGGLYVSDLFERDLGGSLWVFTVSGGGTTTKELFLGDLLITGAPAATIATVSTVVQPVSSTPTSTPTPRPPTPTPTPRPPTPTPTPLPKQCVHPPCRVEN